MNRRHHLALGAVAVGLAALTGGSAEALAAAQMFKCIIGGRTIYQQQACRADAEAPNASAAAGSAPVAATTPSQATAERKAKPASRPASSVPATLR